MHRQGERGHACSEWVGVVVDATEPVYGKENNRMGLRPGQASEMRGEVPWNGGVSCPTARSPTDVYVMVAMVCRRALAESSCRTLGVHPAVRLSGREREQMNVI
jgi:hypothetical protein